MFKRDNGNVHRAAAKIIVSKSRAARGSVCIVLLSREVSIVRDFQPRIPLNIAVFTDKASDMIRSVPNVTFRQ